MAKAIACAARILVPPLRRETVAGLVFMDAYVFESSGQNVFVRRSSSQFDFAAQAGDLLLLLLRELAAGPIDVAKYFNGAW